MIILDSTKDLKAVLSGAVSTDQPEYSFEYADSSSSSFTEGSTEGELNGTTEVTLVSSPSTGTRRIIKTYSILNKDSAAVTVRIYKDTGTERDVDEITLQSGDKLTQNGVYDSNGNLKQVITYAGTVVTLTDAQTLTNKTLTALSNTIYADQIHLSGDNETGVQIDKASAVYASDYNVGNDTTEIELADATNTAKMPAIGITFEDIATGSVGAVARIGVIEGVDTSSYTVGTVLYVSETAGELTSTPPSSVGSVIQPIAIVTRSNAGSGVITVLENISYKITASADGDVVAKIYAENNFAALSGGNTFSGVQEFDNGFTAGGGSDIFSAFEVGNWTPSIFGSTTSGTASYTTQVGRYVIIGDMVFLTFYIRGSFTSAPAGQPTISGIPEPVNSSWRISALKGAIGYAKDNVYIFPAEGTSLIKMGLTSGITNGLANAAFGTDVSDTDFQLHTVIFYEK